MPLSRVSLPSQSVSTRFAGPLPDASVEIASFRPLLLLLLIQTVDLSKRCTTFSARGPPGVGSSTTGGLGLPLSFFSSGGLLGGSCDFLSLESSFLPTCSSFGGVLFGLGFG